MAYLNVVYTALMTGRNTEQPWGRKQSPDALVSNEPARIKDAADLLIPADYTDREAAAMTEQLIDMWIRSTIEPALSDLDPKNTYKRSLLDEFTQDELKLFNPSEITYRLSGSIEFKNYPILKDIYVNEEYWVDKLSAVVAYVVYGRVEH